MIAAYNDYDKGITPVNLGRSAWVTGSFVEAMHTIRAAVNKGNADALERTKRKANH